jgi:hypothetical protein
MQYKLLLCQVFKAHKETIRRGIKLYSPLKTTFGGTIWSQDDQPFMRMSEAYEYLMQENGIDIDAPLFMALENSGLSKEERNKKVFSKMSTNKMQPYSLSSFCHRIYYNIDDMFIFKKQFTIHYTAGSFLSYALDQPQDQVLSQI